MQTMKFQHHQMQHLISKHMKMRENISNVKHQKPTGDSLRHPDEKTIDNKKCIKCQKDPVVPKKRVMGHYRSCRAK